MALPIQGTRKASLQFKCEPLVAHTGLAVSRGEAVFWLKGVICVSMWPGWGDGLLLSLHAQGVSLEAIAPPHPGLSAAARSQVRAGS